MVKRDAKGNYAWNPENMWGWKSREDFKNDRYGQERLAQVYFKGLEDEWKNGTSRQPWIGKTVTVGGETIVLDLPSAIIGSHRIGGNALLNRLRDLEKAKGDLNRITWPGDKEEDQINSRKAFEEAWERMKQVNKSTLAPWEVTKPTLPR